MRFLSKAGLYAQMDNFRKEYGFDYHFEEEALAKKLKIKLSYYCFDSTRLAGALLRGEKHSEIILSANRRKKEQRFTFAHELCHWYLHSGATFCCGEDDAGALEWQANQGAAELLMPYREVLRFIKNISSLYKSSSPRVIKLFIEHFGDVTPTMAKIRLEELSGEIDEYLSGVPMDKINILSRRKAPAPKRSVIDL